MTSSDWFIITESNTKDLGRYHWIKDHDNHHHQSNNLHCHLWSLCQIYCWCIFDKYPLAYILLRTNYLRPIAMSAYIFISRSLVYKSGGQGTFTFFIAPEAGGMVIPSARRLGGRADAYKHDNLITPWLLILLLHVISRSSSTFSDWPNFKVTHKLKSDNFIIPWLSQFWQKCVSRYG